jgi:hypothetical protein
MRPHLHALRILSSDFYLAKNLLKSNTIFLGGNFKKRFPLFLWMKLLNSYKILEQHHSFMDEYMHFWMNTYAFIHDFHISSMLVDVNISMPPSDIVFCAA